ncbi:hypothetical protein QB910_000052 [Dabrowskivirus KKP3916]|uniref:Uncharacterized protein n=1 Tax=Alicyclobacillus phage KKP_3916 TaxID=3040651 RepID=A0AAT9V7L2_9CAUD|nr:hypothetical protein QB910_000052 [Alicyclobacillus phage KKP 3916]
MAGRWFGRSRWENEVVVQCNGCNKGMRLSPQGRLQLFTLTNEYYGWTKSEYGILCPTCSDSLKEAMKVKFHLLATEGFSDVKLVEQALAPLKKAGHTFVTNYRNTAVVEGAKNAGVAISFDNLEGDIAMIFHHTGESIDHLRNSAKQTYVHVSKEPKAVNPYLQHLQNNFPNNVNSVVEASAPSTANATLTEVPEDIQAMSSDITSGEQINQLVEQPTEVADGASQTDQTESNQEETTATN